MNLWFLLGLYLPSMCHLFIMDGSPTSLLLNQDLKLVRYTTATLYFGFLLYSHNGLSLSQWLLSYLFKQKLRPSIINSKNCLLVIKQFYLHLFISCDWHLLSAIPSRCNGSLGWMFPISPLTGGLQTLVTCKAVNT